MAFFPELLVRDQREGSPSPPAFPAFSLSFPIPNRVGRFENELDTDLKIFLECGDGGSLLVGEDGTLGKEDVDEVWDVAEDDLEGGLGRGDVGDGGRLLLLLSVGDFSDEGAGGRLEVGRGGSFLTAAGLKGTLNWGSSSPFSSPPSLLLLLLVSAWTSLCCSSSSVL